MDYKYNPDYKELPNSSHVAFMGYKRDNGDVGIRNEVWIIPTVGCVNSVVKQIEKSVDFSEYKNIDGVYSYEQMQNKGTF